MVTVILNRDYGWVVAVASASVLEMAWMSINVGMARKKLGIELPKEYADKEDCGGDTARIKLFNCMQRAHMNTLEHYPQFLGMLLLGGFAHPRLTAAAGGVWLLGRVVYFLGYSTGDPEKRHRGDFRLLAELALVGINAHFAYRLLAHR